MERVDAWLVTAQRSTDPSHVGVGASDIWELAQEIGGRTGGHIHTCGSRSAITSVSGWRYDECSRPLIINGPVIAGTRLNNWRTGGAGIGRESADPAEVFNLRADTYLWLHHRIQDNRAAHTSVTFELAPRL